jgi:alpha-galactosidase
MQRKILYLFFTFFCLASFAQNLNVSRTLFHWGDNTEWKNPKFNDADWQSVAIDKSWRTQNMNKEKTYAWYRIHFTIDETVFDGSDQRRTLVISLPFVDDADVTYLNGVRIGSTGRLPDSAEGYSSAWDVERNYKVKASDVNFRGDNVIAVRMWNNDGDGGMFGDRSGGKKTYINIYAPTRLDGLTLSAQEKTVRNQRMLAVNVVNEYNVKQQGRLSAEVKEPETGHIIYKVDKPISVAARRSVAVILPFPEGYTRLTATYTDKKLGREKTISYTPKYILTPKAPASPRFNMAGVYGVRPGSPVIYRLPVSGQRPMKFTVSNLPEGLTLDSDNGIISGKLDRRGDYDLNIAAENAAGKAEATLTIKVGNTIALTPPMGWNSWNCWGLSVSQEKVMSSAKALIDKGLADYGYSYINVDDSWESESRNADGTIAVNEKFPDMKKLGDWLHKQGLKFGIYSSPGDRTCGGYLGSLDHEMQDAETYNSWGIDYLKYDWCGYSRKHETEPDNTTVASFVRPYLLMERCLRMQPRDIFYSLCQYGMQDVWKWGHAVDANSWRTTGDITDTWNSLYDIGFVRQKELHPYAGPGHWNDPDMLIVGKVGWSENLRDTRLTPDEQYTHISLWSLLASNMLIGCDLAQLDDFTIGLLCNNEVNAVNQDILGKQARQEIDENGIQIWKRPLSDGTYAVGIFNLNDDDATVDFGKYMEQLGLSGVVLRDLWRQKDITDKKYFIPTHGVKLLKVR